MVNVAEHTLNEVDLILLAGGTDGLYRRGRTAYHRNAQKYEDTGYFGDQ